MCNYDFKTLVPPCRALHSPAGKRGVYSFCMCPGGQIVPTSTNPEELCINGMSFRCASMVLLDYPFNDT